MTGRAWTDKTLTRARAVFLQALTGGASIGMAAREANVGRATVYLWKQKDPDFAALWEEALEVGIDALEDEARRRAVEGVERPIVSHGKLVRDEAGAILKVREYSDALLMMLLKAKRPEQYRERFDVNSKSTSTVVHISGPDAEL